MAAPAVALQLVIAMTLFFVVKILAIIISRNIVPKNNASIQIIPKENSIDGRQKVLLTQCMVVTLRKRSIKSRNSSMYSNECHHNFVEAETAYEIKSSVEIFRIAFSFSKSSFSCSKYYF
jgi:hypothetical protein